MNEAAPRRRTKHPEHNLQVQIVKFVRDCVAVPHFLMSFDRSRKQSALQHVREAARGIRSGQTDTCLLYPGGSLWVELKAAKGGKPTPAQERVMSQIRAVGAIHGAATAYCVEDYLYFCIARSIPLRPMAALQAEHLDRLLAAPEMRVRGPARPAKPRAARASRRALAIVRENQRP